MLKFDNMTVINMSTFVTSTTYLLRYIIATFFLYNLSFGFEDEVTKVSLLIFIEVIFSAALTFFFYGLNRVNQGLAIYRWTE